MVTQKDLSKAERRVWKAFARGEHVDFRRGDPEADDPSTGGEWGKERQVRAKVITALLRGAVPAEPGHAASLWLTGARIVGALDLGQTEIEQMIRLHGCWLGDGVNLFSATTRTLDLSSSFVRILILSEATIEGQLNLSGAQLVNPHDFALVGDNVRITGAVLCDEGFRAEGMVRLPYADIGGQLSFRGARLTNRDPYAPHRFALLADHMRVTGDMFCDEGFRADGAINLPGARIGGRLDLDGARLSNPDGFALFGQQMTVAGNVYGRNLRTEGSLYLPGADIGGQLSLSGAELTNPGGNALFADGITVANDVLLQRAAGVIASSGFRAKGAVRLPYADIGGQLVLTGARLSNPTGIALLADQMKVAGEMFCDGGFRATGEIHLLGARVGVMIDDDESWSSPALLDGFAYGDLRPYRPARERLAWLDRMPEYRPQPYEQLAAHYRAFGHDEQARRVQLAKMRARTRQRPWWGRLGGLLHNALVGYGYAPGRALAWLAGAFAAGWAFFAFHRPDPLKAGEHPTFHAAVYALDLLLPAPALGQEQAWNPQGIAIWVATALRIFGWVLAIAVAASLTNVLTRK